MLCPVFSTITKLSKLIERLDNDNIFYFKYMYMYLKMMPSNCQTLNKAMCQL